MQIDYCMLQNMQIIYYIILYYMFFHLKMKEK